MRNFKIWCRSNSLVASTNVVSLRRLPLLCHLCPLVSLRCCVIKERFVQHLQPLLAIDTVITVVVIRVINNQSCLIQTGEITKIVLALLSG